MWSVSQRGCSPSWTLPQQVARGGASPPVQQMDSHCLAGSTKEAAKVVAHATDHIRVHLRSQDKDTDLCMKLGTSCALAVESCLTKSTASSLHRPPVSMPTTTSLQRREATSSGYLASLFVLAFKSTTPSTSAALRCGSLARVNTQRSVMSTASCAPQQHGRSCAKTSMRLLSWAATPTFMSRRFASKRTRAPASRQTRANTLSVGVARFFTRPLSVHAALWRPRASKALWHPFACRFRHWQRQLQSLQEQHTEQLRRDRVLLGCGSIGEGGSRIATGM